MNIQDRTVPNIIISVGDLVKVPSNLFLHAQLLQDCVHQDHAQSEIGDFEH